MQQLVSKQSSRTCYFLTHDTQRLLLSADYLMPLKAILAQCAKRMLTAWRADKALHAITLPCPVEQRICGLDIPVPADL